MPERRETGRKRANLARRTPNSEATSWDEGERIAKYLARCGVASRREAEALIAAGKVFVNGERLASPAVKVSGREEIRVGRKRVTPPEPARLWRYHKPAGLITTTSDPEGRRTIFQELPKSLPRVMAVGRLDLTTEGLLLLTNDGDLARQLELPKNTFRRVYRARAFGKATQARLDTLKTGIDVEGERYAPITAILERETGANNWLAVELSEGKNREVRKALEAIDLQVNRLIRTAYGPFDLGDLSPGAIEEVPAETLLAELGEFIPEARKPRPAATSPFKGRRGSGRNSKHNGPPQRPQHKRR